MRLGSVRLASSSTVAFVALLLLATLPARASSTWTSDHEFQFEVPDGWTIQLNAAERYNEPDLKAMAQTPDQTQEINVYHETLGPGERTAMDYLQNGFRSAAANRENFRSLGIDAWDVDGAVSGAYGTYTYTDNYGVVQEVDRVVAVRGNDVYELNVLPTQAYARQHPDEIFNVLDSFELLP
jgi:hypothetical protein